MGEENVETLLDYLENKPMLRVDPDDEHMIDTLFVGDDCDEDNLEDSDEEN